MIIFLFTFGSMLLMVVAMSIGYIIKKKKLAGSCGGISGLGLEKACDCEDPCDKRKAKMAAEEASKKEDTYQKIGSYNRINRP